MITPYKVLFERAIADLPPEAQARAREEEREREAALAALPRPPLDPETKELLDWAKNYVRSFDRKKKIAALEAHFQREFQTVAEDEKLLQRAIFALQIQFGIPAAALFFGGMALGASADNAKTWSDAGLGWLGILLMLGGLACLGLALGVSSQSGFSRWRESIQSRREALRKECKQRFEELESSLTAAQQ